MFGMHVASIEFGSVMGLADAHSKEFNSKAENQSVISYQIKNTC